MKSIIILALIALSVENELGNKEYVIDLNLPPRERYRQIVNEYKNSLLQVFNSIKDETPKDTWRTISNAYGTVVVNRYKEYAEEIAGIANILGITPEDYYVINCFYELIVMCTSIVAKDKNNKLILARNFDFGHTEILRKIHINVMYMRNNKVVAKCGNIAGYIGVFTCLKPGAFAVSMNARPMSNVQDFISRLLEGRILSTWLLRDTILNVENYEDAVREIKRAMTVSGSYIIIAGMKEYEGTVITRARDSIVSSRELSRDTWYLVKCNSDDNVTTDERTNWATQAMTKLKQSNTNLDTILSNVLMEHPILRSNTVSTILMSPVDNYFKSIIATKEITEDSLFY